MTDRPVIAVPSYKRPKAKIFRKLCNIPLDKYVFVRQEDYEDYKSVAHENGFKIVRLKKVSDIGDTRQAIVRYFNAKSINWVFMFDDDIRKIESLDFDSDKERFNSARILYEPEEPPRIEFSALLNWFRLAQFYNISLSSPNHRNYDRYLHGYININGSVPIQCVLVNVPDIMAAGNYASLRLVGNEDYYITYKLLTKGYTIAKIGSIEYDVPVVGSGQGGCNACEDSDLNNRYETYVNTFLKNVCDDPEIIGVKTTSSGQKSIKFNWRNLGKKLVPLQGFRR